MIHCFKKLVSIFSSFDSTLNKFKCIFSHMLRFNRRMYPVVPGNGRLTVDSEVIVDNCWFPKKVTTQKCASLKVLY